VLLVVAGLDFVQEVSARMQGREARIRIKRERYDSGLRMVM